MENLVNPQENCCSTDNKKKCCLCSPQMIFNIVAALLIVILIVLQFFNPFGTKSKAIINGTGGLSIAYVVSDSVMNQYELVDTLEAQLEKITDSLAKDFAKKQESFQARVNIFQQNVQSGKIQTKDEYSRQETALAAEQQQLMNLNDQYESVRQNKIVEINVRIVDSLTSIIKRYPEEFPYDFILSRSVGILYASDKYDITDQVIEKMNKEYEPE